METTPKLMARRALATTLLATAAIIVLLSIELHEPGNNVSVHLFVACAAVGVASGVAWVMATCAKLIFKYIDERVSDRRRDEDLDRRIEAIVNNLAEIRLALGEFAATVGEYGDQRAQAARLDALQALAETPTGTDAGRTVRHLPRRTAP